MLHIKFKYPAWQFLLLLPMALCACAGDEANTPTPSDNGTPVSFSASDRWNNDETRLVEDDKTTSFSAGDNIGVFAYKGTSQTPDFMNNQRVTYDGSAWNYSPIKYWPQNDELSFYAYYPYNYKDISVVAGKGVLSLKYNTSTADKDILAAVAKGVGYSDKNETVPLPFSHILAKVKFTFSANPGHDPVIYALKYDIPEGGTYNLWQDSAGWSSISNTRHPLERLVSNSEGIVIKGANNPINEFTAFILPCEIEKFSVSINNVYVDYTPLSKVSVKAGCQYTINFAIAGDGNSNFFITSYSLWETDDEIHEGKLQ